MDLLMRLEKQAPLQGGAVHCLIGNHEAMNLTGDYRYVSEGEAASHGGMKQLARNMGPRGRYGGWILEHNAVVRINNAVFLHAGISQPFSEASIAGLNEMVHKLSWNGTVPMRYSAATALCGTVVSPETGPPGWNGGSSGSSRAPGRTLR